jgi:hypothetical protein
MERLRTQNNFGALRVIVSLIVILWFGGILWFVLINELDEFNSSMMETFSYVFNL